MCETYGADREAFLGWTKSSQFSASHGKVNNSGESKRPNTMEASGAVQARQGRWLGWVGDAACAGAGGAEGHVWGEWGTHGTRVVL